MTPLNGSPDDPRQLSHQPAAEAGVDPATFTSYDAWFIALALAGRPLEGLAHRLSREHRALAERLGNIPIEERASAWEVELSSLTEADVAVRTLAIADINPDDPPPEDGWGQPLHFKLPPVLLFPLDVLPQPVVRLVRQVAKAINCPPDFPAMTALVVAGASIGRSASLRLKGGYFATSSLFAACVGHPGDGKSPAVRQVTNPMLRIDEAHIKQWAIEKAEFDAAEAEREEVARGFRRSRPKRDQVDGEAFGDASPLCESPAAAHAGAPGRMSPPNIRRNVVNDITIEAMDALMAKNPRGLLQILDEASSLTSSMNQYRGGNGSDRQWYMSAWSGEPRVVDRKGNADFVPIFNPHQFLCLVGGMVPDMIGSFCDKQGRHDGFIDRILFVYPDQVPKTGWHEDGVADDVVTDWSKIVSRLQARQLIVEEAAARPHVVHFSPRGKSAWSKMIDAHHAEQRSTDFAQSLSGPWAKLEQYAGRLTLIFHLLGLAADPTSDDARIPEVTERTVEAASRMLAYLKSHTRRVHEAMKAMARGDEGSDDVQCILKWIFRHQPESFSARDLTRDLTRTFGDRAHAFNDALAWLANKGCIRLQDSPKPARKPKAGRCKSPLYLVNPQLLSSQNRQNRDPGTLHFPASDSGDFATDRSFGDQGEGDHGHTTF